MTIVEDALEAWREAERLLDRIPPPHPDHDTVASAVTALRQTYKALTDGAVQRTPSLIADCRESIERTKVLLASVHSTTDDPTPPEAA